VHALPLWCSWLVLKHFHFGCTSVISILYALVGHLGNQVVGELADAHARIQQIYEVTDTEARLSPCQYQDISRRVQSLDTSHAAILNASEYLHHGLLQLTRCREPMGTRVCSSRTELNCHPVG